MRAFLVGIVTIVLALAGGLALALMWRAIYEYLSAIPCNPGKVIAGAPYLQNVCE